MLALLVALPAFAQSDTFVRDLFLETTPAETTRKIEVTTNVGTCTITFMLGTIDFAGSGCLSDIRFNGTSIQDTGPEPDCGTATDMQVGDGSCVDPATQVELNAHTAVSDAHHAKTTSALELISGTIPVARVGADHIDALSEIDGALCADGETLVNSSGTSWGCGAGGGGARSVPRIQGRWYNRTIMPAIIFSTDTALVADRLYAVPAEFEAGEQIDGWGFDVAAGTGAAGLGVMLCIYNADNTTVGLPGTSLCDSGEILTESAGTKTSTTDCTVTDAGQYWFVLHAESASVSSDQRIQAEPTTMFGQSNAGLQSEYRYIRGSTTYSAGTCPDMSSASWTFDTGVHPSFHWQVK